MACSLATSSALAQETATQAAQEKEIQTVVTDVSDQGIYLDQGRESGLVTGLIGIVRHQGIEVGRLRIERLASRSALATSVSAPPPRIEIGDSVTFVVPLEAAARETLSGEAPFVPLLAPREGTSPRGPHDVIGGHLGFRTTYTRNQEIDRSYRYDRAFSRGSWERIAGEPWSIEWDLDLNRRDGSGYRDHSGYEELEGRVDLFAVTRRLEEGFVSFGRLDPLVLPSLGPVDGIQGELELAEGVHSGVVAGFRPDRETFGFRTEEVVLFPYAVFETGSRGATYSVTTTGVEGSWFEGKTDRHALHLDQMVDLDAWLRLRLSSELDLYTGSEPSRSGLGLTRLTMSADLWPRESFGLYTRIHHYQRPDTRAERDRSAADRAYDSGHNRFSIGSRQKSGSDWSFYEEVSYLGGADTGADWQGRLGLNKSEILGFESVSAGFDVFNTVGLDQSGLGGRVYANWTPSYRCNFLLAFDSSSIDYSGEGDETVTSSSLSLDAFWLVTDTVSVNGAVRHDFGDAEASDTLSAGVTWRF
ncbi:MAG: hypothetical protein AB1486_11675 [Planctomycetota bacterium]